MADDGILKTCAKCKEAKPLTEFYKRGERNAPRSRCKVCMEADRAETAETHRKRAADWRAKDPGRARASVRQSYQNNIAKRRSYDCERRQDAEFRERKRVYLKEKYDNDPAFRAKLAVSRKAWINENADRLKAYFAAYWKANPDKAREYHHRRRARKRNAGGTHTAEDIADIRKMQRDRCAICRTKLKGRGHLDHIKALVNGGSNDRRNLQLLCQPCNSRKRSRDQIDFMREQGFLL